MRGRPLLYPVVGLVWCALTLAVASPASADRLVASGSYIPQSLTAYHGLVVWGAADPFGAGQWYLSSTGSAVTRLNINRPGGAGSLGDIDLGSGRHGGTVAVYERCRGTTSGDSPAGCDIYRYGLASGRTSRVRGASSRHYEERMPSVWRGRVAFRRSRFDSNQEDVFRGPHLGLFATPPLVRLARPRASVHATDLRGRRVAFATDAHGVSKIYVKRFGRRGRGRSCQVARATRGVVLSEAQLDGDYVYWSRLDQFFQVPAPWTIHRRRVPTRHCRSRGPEQLSPRTFGETLQPTSPSNPPSTTDEDSFAVHGGRIFYTRTVSTVVNAFETIRGEIWRMEPVSFQNR